MSKKIRREKTSRVGESNKPELDVSFFDNDPFAPSSDFITAVHLSQTSFPAQSEPENSSGSVWEDGHIKHEPMTIVNNVSKTSPSFDKVENIFDYFFSAKLVDYIYSQTNKTVQIERRKGVNIVYISKEEIYSFMSISFYMGVDVLPNLKLYWFKEPNQKIDLRREYVYSMMSYARFIQIRKHLRLTTPTKNETNIDNRIEDKTKESINNINKILEGAKYPDYNVAIDESTIAHKGRFGALVYNKTKPDKWGIKLYVLASSNSGYAHKIKLYTGKSNSIGEIVSVLTTNLVKPHHLFVDNYYMSIENLENCSEKNIYLTGTCRANRKGLPKKLVSEAKKVLNKGEMILINNKKFNGILLQDRKFVILLSSIESVERNEFVETNRYIKMDGVDYKILTKNKNIGFITSYNKNMNGVDLLDQKMQYYDCNRKSSRWTLKISLAVLNVFACNSYILYTENKLGNMTRLNFNLMLSNWLKEKSEGEKMISSCFNHPIKVSESASFSCSVVGEEGSSTVGKKTGKKPKTEIKFVEKEEDFFEYCDDFHKKYTTESWLRCFLCYSNGLTTRTRDYCKKCKKSLCNNKKCWDKHHFRKESSDK